MQNSTKALIWAGIALILVTGLVHLVEVPDAFEEATYKGILFAANFIAAVIAAIGIWRGERWGWGLALVVAVGSLIGYTLSRTVGLPQLPAEPDEWLEPIGVVSLLAEGMLVVVAVWAMRQMNRSAAAIGVEE